MHRSRSNRKANQERRERAARYQKPLPVEMQANLAAVRKAEEAQWAQQGYNSPTYAREPRTKGPSVRKQLADGGMFGGLFNIILRQFAAANPRGGFRGRNKQR